MKTAVRFIAVLFFLTISPSRAQENKVHDSLLEIYHTMSKDTTRVEMLYDLHESVLFNNTELSKSYADKFLLAAKEYGTNRQVGSAYYAKSMVQRTIGNKDSHNIYVAKAKKIFQEENYLRGIIDTDKAMAIIHDEGGRDDEAIQLLLQNIEKDKIIKDTAYLAGDYKHLAGIYVDKSNFELALDYCLKSLKLYEQIDRPVLYADALYQMGSIEGSLGNRANAIKNYSKALDIYIEQNDVLYQSIAHDALGRSHFLLKNYDKSEEHLKRALALARQMKSTVSEANILFSLGGNEIELENLDKGISYLKSALVLAEKNERTGTVIGILYQMAEAELLKKSDKAALGHVNRGINISEAIKEFKSLSDFLKLRSKIYENQNKIVLAMEDYKKYETIKDSLFTIEKSKQIEEMRAIYDTEKKEQQIARQETEIVLLEEKEKVSSLQKWLLGSGLGLSLLALGFGFYGFRQKIKRNQLEKEKVDAELAFKKKELTTHAMHLAKKNEVLEAVKQKAKELKTSENGEHGYRQLIQTINFDQQDDKNWESFTQYFEQVHKDFSKTVKKKYPEVTKNELRFMALLKMNLSSKEIATILNISPEGVKKARQRLRKKMELSPEESLESTVLSL